MHWPDIKKRTTDFATGYIQDFEFKICVCKHIFKNMEIFIQKGYS